MNAMLQLYYLGKNQTRLNKQKALFKVLMFGLPFVVSELCSYYEGWFMRRVAEFVRKNW